MQKKVDEKTDLRRGKNGDHWVVDADGARCCFIVHCIVLYSGSLAIVV